MAKLRAKRKEKRAEYHNGFERVRIEGKAKIEETDDFWIVKENVLVKAGVFNGIRRNPEILADVWLLYEGIPITHPHPEGLVEDLEIVGGIVQGVEWDEENGRVLADYAYAKHENISGLRVSPEMVALNEETIRRVRAGEHVENSQGYLFQFVEEKGELDGKEYGAKMTVLIPNHLATLLDEDGACSWEDGCGLARLALERAAISQEDSTLDDQGSSAERRARGARRSGREEGTQGKPKPAPAGRMNAEDTHMCDKDCTGNCATAKELKAKLEKFEPITVELQAARGALEKLQNHKATGGGEAAKTPAGLVAVLTERLDKLARFEEAEAKAHEDLATEVATLALELTPKEKRGKEADLVSHYKTWPAPALLEHRSLLEATKARAKGGERTRKDNLRAGAEGAEEATTPRTSVGVFNGKEWVA